jgi:zinc transport system substrate-binding protein
MVLMRSSLVLVTTTLMLGATLSACGESASDASESEGVQVVTAFYPLQYVTERVGGDTADVSVLTGPGQEPHDAELTVSQTAELAEADVVVHLSDFQPVVDESVEQNAGGIVVDSAHAARLVESSGDDGHGHGEDEEAHSDEAVHSDEEGAEEGDDHADQDTHGDGEALDPHFWLDPTRVADVGAEIADALAEADPDNAETYRANLADLESDLTALDEELSAGLAECERREVVVSHDAFGYLAERYDLDMHPIAGLSPDAEPSAAHLRELQDLIRDEGITTVFSETLASPAMAETLSADLGLETAVLDPIEGLSDESADEDYLSLMRQNLTALQEANGCR